MMDPNTSTPAKALPKNPDLPAVIETASGPIMDPKPEYFFSATKGKVEAITLISKCDILKEGNTVASVDAAALYFRVHPGCEARWLPPIQTFCLN